MTGSSPEPASLIPSGGLGSIAMASLYPKTGKIGLEAGVSTASTGNDTDSKYNYDL